MAIINGTNGNDTLDGTAQADRINGFGGDDELFGDAGNDSLFGGDGNDELNGGSGLDSLVGGDGDDTLGGFGDTGGDTLRGGAGNDIYAAEIGDVIVEASNGGVETILWGKSDYRLGRNLENLDVSVSGSPSPEPAVTLTFYGNGLANNIEFSNYILFSAPTAQVNLYGLSGDDRLSILFDSGQLFGGSGNDTLSATPSNFGGLDIFNGGSGNDSLDTGEGNDQLIGGSGNDTLVGYGSDSAIERDTLTGGINADIFIIDGTDRNYLGGNNTTGFAILTDFSRVQGDKIQVVNGRTYTLDQTIDRGVGSATIDTAVFRDGDLIAIVQDRSTITINADFVFV